MKTKAVLLALFVAGLAVSAAVADPGKGKGNAGAAAAASTGTTSTGTTTSASPGAGKGKKADGCARGKSIVLRGALVSKAADGSSLAMTVAGGNKAGRAFAGKQLTVRIDGATKVKREGVPGVAALVVGDRLKVQGRACTADATALTVLARKVIAHPAAAATTTTTATTTTQ